MTAMYFVAQFSEAIQNHFGERALFVSLDDFQVLENDPIGVS